jgi:DNA-binding LytR/AlgR family response regulator
LKVAFVDNNRQDMDNLTSSITKYSNESFDITSYDTYSNGESFLSEFYANKYDIVFLDIFMDTLSGVDVAFEIRKSDQNVKIVFCTTSNEFATESYQVDAFYYLVKPFSDRSIKQLIHKLSSLDFELSQFIRISDNIKIYPRNIIYTEYENHKIIIHQKDGNNLCIRMPQHQWEELICNYSYIVNCFKGIIVNLYEVESKTDNSFSMSNGETLPISRRNIKEMNTIYSDFLFQKLRKDMLK